MPLFNVVVREHTYTGRFYSDVVQAGSCEEALQAAAQHATVPRPPPGPGPQPGSDVAATRDTGTRRPDTDVAQASRREAVQVVTAEAAAPEPPPGPAPQHGFSVVVYEQAYAARVYSDVVQAGSPEEALEAAAQAATPEPSPGSTPQAEAAGRPRCADVWVYALLHCERAAGHDPPHMAVAHGYRRPVRWVRDDLGVAHAVLDPAAPPAVPPVTPPSPAREAEPPAAPFTGTGS